MNSNFLDEFISNPKFQIDTLLPNYLIYNKINPDDLQSTTKFNEIMAQIKEKFQLTIRFYMQSIRKDQVPKKQHITQQIEESLEETEMHPILKEKLLLDLQVFLYALTQLQDLYTLFFKTDFFSYVEQHDILDDRVNLNWFNSILEKGFIHFLAQTLGTAKGLLYQLIIEQLDYTDLIILLNKVVVQIFTDCSSSLHDITSEFIHVTNSCNLCNKYLLMGLFQELSVRAYDLVENYQDYTVFHLSSQDLKEEFARLVINHFDQMTLYINQHDEDLYTPFQNSVLKYVKNNDDEISVIEEALNKMVNKNKKIVTHKIISKHKLRPGLLIEIEGEDTKMRFIIHKPVDKIVVTNAKLVQNRWMFVEALQQLTPEQLLLKKQESQEEYSSIESAFNSLHFQIGINKLQEEFNIEEERIQFVTFNESTAQIQNGFSETIKLNGLQGETLQGLQGETFNTHFSNAAGDIGASLGNCLANINKYSSRKEFLADFGQTAVVSGSLTYIATQMPVIGQLFALGAFGYFTAKIYSNDSSSQRGKNTQLSKLVISTTANVGSGLGGALIGQALIPVPIVGALIGGFIGGLLGGASSSMILEYMSEQRYATLFEQIQFKQDQGHWDYSDEYLNQLGLSRQIFDEQMPNNLRFDEYRDMKWITIISYSYCTVFQAQLDNEKMKKQSEKQSENGSKHSFQDSEQGSSKNLEIKNSETDTLEFPEFIESASKWIIQNRCLMGLSLSNIETIIKCIFQNL